MPSTASRWLRAGGSAFLLKVCRIGHCLSAVSLWNCKLKRKPQGCQTLREKGETSWLAPSSIWLDKKK